MSENTSLRIAEDLGGGVAVLDRDHDVMMSLAQQIARFRRIADFDGAVAALAQLLSAAEIHWRREEDMLRLYGYPGTDEHARGHAAAKDRLAGLYDRLAHHDNVFHAEDAVVRLLIDDSRWKWWFLDAGLRPQA